MVTTKPEWERTNQAVVTAILKLGNPAFGDLLKETGLSKPSLTEHLKELLNRKLIITERSQEDKRKWLYKVNPNELLIITIDEAIEAIREELKAVGEDLKPDEEDKLRTILPKEIREFIKDILLQASTELTSKQLLFSAINSCVSYRLLAKELESLVSNLTVNYTAEDFLSAFKDIVQDKTISNIVSASMKIPLSFAEKWSKTKAFKTSALHAFTKSYTAFLPKILEIAFNYAKNLK